MNAKLPIVTTPAAENDLTEIWLNIAAENSRSADRFLDKIAFRIQQLASFPGSGPRRPEIATDARSLTIGNYIVLYRFDSERVEILRVVHGARDITTLL